MTPLPTSILGASARWLWRNLDGPAAAKTSRLCIFVILIAMWVGAYWAITTRGHIEQRLDGFLSTDAARNAELNVTLAHIADAIEGLHTTVAQHALELAQLTDRVGRAEGQIIERRRHDE